MQEKNLNFEDWVAKIEGKLGKEEWVTVYSHKREDFEWVTFFCTMISNDKVKEILDNPSWELTIGQGLPGFNVSYEEGKQTESYFRFPFKGIEPLVFARDFYGMKKNYKEISEEFRFYFNLYEDRNNNKFIYIEGEGDEQDMVIIQDDEIKVKLKFLKEFLAVKNMSLALYFDIFRFSEKTLDELKIKEFRDKVKTNSYVYELNILNSEIFSDKKKSQASLIGKKIIPGLKGLREKRLEQGNEYEEFIIGVDENGNEIMYTCDHEKLADYFGKNPDAPNFLTPVFFRKEVLNDYYANPDKYTVTDGRLRCGGLWSMKMDNNHDTYVVVFLGYLGQSLSLKEQQRWKRFNITREGAGISWTEWQRGFMGQFADPVKSDLYFKQKFESFQDKWNKTFGWFLFKPLREEDGYYLKTLRIPLTDSQKEFDEQVLALTKIIIDSLNEAELVKGIKLDENNLKGIDKLDRFIISKDLRFEGMIEFLKDLQALRSSGSAHRKGKNYGKALKKIAGSENNFQKIFDEILINAIRVMNTLEEHLLDS